jgi:hypothetical protein
MLATILKAIFFWAEAVLLVTEITKNDLTFLTHSAVAVCGFMKAI